MRTFAQLPAGNWLPKQDDPVDVYVMTSRQFSLLKQHLPEPPPRPTGTQEFANAIVGIPVEAYPTKKEAFMRAMQLREAGKWVALIRD
jgi:hypothetical protein